MDIQEFAKMVAARSAQCRNEEGVKQFLIIPFLQHLGYNVFDPDEVRPEHHADFSDKYKNRVDYAVFTEGEPRIGIEAKTVGAPLTDARGQLRSYFNAAPSIKLGILTDGIRYECYADTDEPNIMDDAPFLSFDLAMIAEAGADDTTAEGISGLSKAHFDPDNLGATARQKLLLSAFVRLLRQWSASPSEELVRAMLGGIDYQNRMTRKVMDDATPIAREAFKVFIEREILKRVGIADRDLETEDRATAPPPEPAEPVPASGIVTTEDELAAFDYARKRLAFLVDSEGLFSAIEGIEWRDMKTTFKVFYKKQNAGSLFNYISRASGEMTFTFPGLDDKEITTTTISDIDEALLAAFRLRVEG